MTSNRNPMKQFFITFPKSGLVTREAFTDSLPDCVYSSCAQESHEDGSPHLHIITVFVEKITKSKLLKHLAKAYPNDNKRIQVQALRSLKHAGDYINKEDTQVYEVGIKPIKHIPYKRLPQHEKDKIYQRVCKEFFENEVEKLKKAFSNHDITKNNNNN